MITALVICAAIGLVALGALLALIFVGANHHPHPGPITPALHQPPYESWTEDEHAWDMQLTSRDTFPYDQNADGA